MRYVLRLIQFDNITLEAKTVVMGMKSSGITVSQDLLSSNIVRIRGRFSRSPNDVNYSSSVMPPMTRNNLRREVHCCHPYRQPKTSVSATKTGVDRVGLLPATQTTTKLRCVDLDADHVTRMAVIRDTQYDSPLQRR